MERNSDTELVVDNIFCQQAQVPAGPSFMTSSATRSGLFQDEYRPTFSALLAATRARLVDRAIRQSARPQLREKL
jgi:hypothetical protein